jgi:hypothetical protein
VAGGGHESGLPVAGSRKRGPRTVPPARIRPHKSHEYRHSSPAVGRHGHCGHGERATTKRETLEMGAGKMPALRCWVSRPAIEAAGRSSDSAGRRIGHASRVRSPGSEPPREARPAKAVRVSGHNFPAPASRALTRGMTPRVGWRDPRRISLGLFSRANSSRAADPGVDQPLAGGPLPAAPLAYCNLEGWTVPVTLEGSLGSDGLRRVGMSAGAFPRAAPGIVQGGRSRGALSTMLSA